MTTIAILAAAGLCVATLAASAGDLARDATPIRLVGETCPQVAPPGAGIERDIVAIDETAAAPRNVCLVFFAADLDDSKG